VPPLSGPDLRASLGRDVLCLLGDIPSPVVEIARLTRLPSPRLQRACFRVGFADGRAVKARRVESPRDAERLERLSSLVDRRYASPLLGRCGGAVLTEWVDGRVVMPADATPAFLRRCGALQARFHQPAVPADLRVEAEDRLRDAPIRLERAVEDLSRHAALSAGERERALELARAYAPRDVRVVLAHGDFCGENLVLDARGRAHLVDNETLAVHAPEYDLGRTWYGWPMTERQRRAYYEGYREHGDTDAFVRHFPYWAVTVLVGAAGFRRRAVTAGARYPLDRLRRLLWARDPARLLHADVPAPEHGG